VKYKRSLKPYGGEEITSVIFVVIKTQFAFLEF